LVGLVAIVNQFAAGQPAFEANAATTGTLPANTYANGTLGVGATLTGNANGALAAQDGVTLTLNQLLLVNAEGTGSHNGLYKITQVGDAGTPYILTRATGMDQSAEFQQGNSINVRAGTINTGTTWKQTSADAPVVGTDAITFARDPGVVTTNTAQTISGLKTFSANPAYTATAQQIADPGTGAAIPVTASGTVEIVTAGAETNTLAIPTFFGQRLTLIMDTRVGGDRVVTSAQAINQAGNTIMTFGAAADMIVLEAMKVGGAFRWRVTANDGVALS